MVGRVQNVRMVGFGLWVRRFYVYSLRCHSFDASCNKQSPLIENRTWLTRFLISLQFWFLFSFHESSQKQDTSFFRMALWLFQNRKLKCLSLKLNIKSPCSKKTSFKNGRIKVTQLGQGNNMYVAWSYFLTEPKIYKKWPFSSFRKNVSSSKNFPAHLFLFFIPICKQEVVPKLRSRRTS